MKKITLLAILTVFYIFVAAQNTEKYTHAIKSSDSNLNLWTCPPTERVFKNSAIPADTENMIKVYAAKNETEPFILVIKPKKDLKVNVKISDFNSEIKTEIFQVKYVNIKKATDNIGKTGDYPDPLMPIENNTSIDLKAEINTAIWFSVSTTDKTPKGDHKATITVGNATVEVKLHVFNFAVPEEIHVKSQMNLNHQVILSKYGVTGTGENYWNYVDKIKQIFIDHRLTPKNPLWSGGLTSGGAPYIDYDCNSTFKDNDGIWGFEHPANKYLKGDGFNNGVGFPSFMAMTFKNNDASADQRPDKFCDISRSASDWVGAAATTSYNKKWFQYVKAIQDYLSKLGYLDKAYYYFANEPQDQTDYDAVAWYSQELKKAAPSLKLMVSEGAKPEIYNNAKYKGAKIDIWLPVLNQYDPEIAHERLSKNNEETWIYFLHGTRPPYFNPITLDHPGIESKLTGWFIWKYRIRGIAYYAMNDWSKNPWTDPMTDGHNGDLFMFYPPSEKNENISYGANNHRFVPSIRFELMRDGLEDYEYLYTLNNNKQPEVYKTNNADNQADKIISSLTSYNRDSEYMYNLRRFIGLKIGGEISAIPDIAPSNLHERSKGKPGKYYINFQDPNGEPKANPLIIENKEYTKIGWNNYDDKLGYGWFGDMSHVMYKYLSDAPNVLQGSILYDDWGREKVFEFDLPNGTYNVTVSAGWQGKTYKRNKIEIEGISFINDEATSPYIKRTKKVTVADYKLTMNMGIFDEYTMLNYIDIEADEIATPIDEKNELHYFNVFPNPFNEIIIVKNKNLDCSNFEVTIYNISGAKMQIEQQIPANGVIEISTKQLPVGFYIIKIKDDKKREFSLKCNKI